MDYDQEPIASNMDDESKDITVQLDLKIGQMFEDYEEMETVIQSACKQKFLQYYKRDSRTIESASKRNTKKIYDPAIRYSEVKYACIHGGREFISRGTGRRKSSTFRKRCPAFIQVRATASANKLVIHNICNQHNHLIKESLFQLLPHNRRDGKFFMKKSNIKKDVQPTTPLTNLHKRSLVLRYDEVTIAVENLREKGVDTRLAFDEGNNFSGLVFATKYMKKTMAAYPELMCVDTLPFDITCQVYVILVEDGNGASITVFAGIFTKETDGLPKFIKLFKEMNPSWEKVRTIMADKENSLKNEFTSAAVLRNLFYIFKILKRNSQNVRINMTVDERHLASSLLQKLILSENETEFGNVRVLIETTLPAVVSHLFSDIWEGLKFDWSHLFGEVTMNFLDGTNHGLYNLNSALKVLVYKYNFQDLTEALYNYIEASQVERSIKLSNLLQKRPATSGANLDFEEQYLNLLTPYASQKLKHQIRDFKNMEIGTNEKDNVTVDTSKCSCVFFRSMTLPCKHIFAIRYSEGLPLFNEDLCHERWTLKYFKSHQLTINSEINVKNIALPNCSKKFAYDNDNKYNEALVKCELLASVVTECSPLEFRRRMDHLDGLIRLWNCEKNENDESEERQVKTELCSEDENYYNECTTIKEEWQPEQV